MNQRIEQILHRMESSCESAALAVVDHLRTVAANGREYSTRKALREEAEALNTWAIHFLKES